MKNGTKITYKRDGGIKILRIMMKNFNMSKMYAELWLNKTVNYKDNLSRKESWLKEKMIAAN